MNQQESKTPANIVGIIPCAGIASRMGRLPCSKELFPVGFQEGRGGKEPYPKTVCHYLLEKLQYAGIEKVHIVIRPGKWDIPGYFLDGGLVGVRLCYHVIDVSYGTVFSLDQAYPFVRDRLVALGFPDILFGEKDAFVRLKNRLMQSDADIVLGVFPADRPDKVDMLEIGPMGDLLDIVIKPTRTNLEYTWGMAVWNPVFTEYIHQFVMESKGNAPELPERYLGDLIRSAMNDGVKVQLECISDQPYIDIGTHEDLMLALKGHMGIPEDGGWKANRNVE